MSKAREVQELLIELLREEGIDAITFERAGLLTNNKGITFEYKGQTFQLALLGTWGE